MAKLDNIMIAFKEGKLALQIDTAVMVGETKNGDPYFANTGGPMDVPEFPGLKIAFALWYKEPVVKEPKAEKAAATMKASTIRLTYEKAGATPEKAAAIMPGGSGSITVKKAR